MAATRVRRNIRKGISSGLRTFPAHFSPYLLTNHPLNEYLAELMIDHGVGVTTEATYELKRIEADYFPEE